MDKRGRRRETAALTGLVVLGLGAIGAGSASLLGQWAPSLPFTRHLASAVPLAEAHAASAEQALNAKQWSKAEAETLAELNVSPVRAGAWLRLAKARVGRSGYLDASAATALSQSYDVEPYDLTLKGERRAFAARWVSATPPALRAAISEEAAAASQIGRPAGRSPAP